jgi:hypothetical protein
MLSDLNRKGAVNRDTMYNCTYLNYTDRKGHKIFLIYKEIPKRSVAKSYIYEEGIPNI